jgi:hypothetical protein
MKLWRGSCENNHQTSKSKRQQGKDANTMHSDDFLRQLYSFHLRLRHNSSLPHNTLEDVFVNTARHTRSDDYNIDSINFKTKLSLPPKRDRFFSFANVPARTTFAVCPPLPRAKWQKDGHLHSRPRADDEYSPKGREHTPLARSVPTVASVLSYSPKGREHTINHRCMDEIVDGLWGLGVSVEKVGGMADTVDVDGLEG